MWNETNTLSMTKKLSVKRNRINTKYTEKSCGSKKLPSTLHVPIINSVRIPQMGSVLLLFRYWTIFRWHSKFL